LDAVIAVLKGMWGVLVFGAPGVGVWRFGGVSFEQALLTLIIYSVIVVLLTFFFVNMAEKLWKRIRMTETGQMIAQSMIVSWIQSAMGRLRNHNNGTDQVKHGLKKKLLKTAPWLVLMLYYLPLPIIGEVVIIVAKALVDTKVLKMRWVLPMLLGGIVFKSWVTCVLWYQIVSL